MAAATAALAAGSPGWTVKRFPVLPVTSDTVPLMGVTPESETTEPIGHRSSDGISRFLTIAVSCFAKDGSSPDNSLDAMVTWAVQKLLPVNAQGDVDDTLGGACAYIDELSTDWRAEVQDFTYQRADVRFRVRYHTKRSDPTVKVG